MKRKTKRFAVWIAEYVDYRRQLGYQLRTEENYLRELAEFMDREAPGQSLTDAWLLRWREAYAHRSPRVMGYLLALIPWLTLRDPGTRVSEGRLHRHRSPRLTPYIYDPEEVLALLDATERLSDHGRGFRRHTYGTLLGLQASTGMRISESLGLDRDDVNWKDGFLSVRESKNVPLRMVPVHETTLDALRQYARIRDKDRRIPRTQAFFVGSYGGRLNYHTFRPVFRVIADMAGVPFRPHPRPPRIHDLRHTFATRHLLRVRQEGGDMHCAVADLSVYLGHARIEDTYWYLTGIPELMALSGERFRAFVEARRGEGRP